MEKTAWLSQCRTFKVSSSFPRQQPVMRKTFQTWNEVTRSGLREMKVAKDLTKMQKMLYINKENRG